MKVVLLTHAAVRPTRPTVLIQEYQRTSVFLSCQGRYGKPEIWGRGTKVAGLAMKKHIEQPSSEENLHFDLCFVATAVCLQKRQGPGREMFGLYSLDVEAVWELSTSFVKPLLKQDRN